MAARSSDEVVNLALVIVGLGVPAPPVGEAEGAREGQTAQNGPTVTDVGSDLIEHAVLAKVDSKSAAVGFNLVRQAQRFWLKEPA